MKVIAALEAAGHTNVRVRWGKLGGEASFSGQANGLWQWQNDVGAMIVENVAGLDATAAARWIEAR